MTFKLQSMQQILTQLQTELDMHESISFSVLNPDVEDVYAGSMLEIEEETYLYRGLKAWSDLAELLHCKMLVPREGVYPCITLTLKKLKIQSSFHLDNRKNKEEKYGVYFKLF